MVSQSRITVSSSPSQRRIPLEPTLPPLATITTNVVGHFPALS